MVSWLMHQAKGSTCVDYDGGGRECEREKKKKRKSATKKSTFTGQTDCSLSVECLFYSFCMSAKI